MGLVRLAMLALVGAMLFFLIRRLMGLGIRRTPQPPDTNLLLSEAPTPGASPQTAHRFTSHTAAHQLAKNEKCRSCGGGVAVQDHFDEAVGGRYYHIVNVVCRKCGARDRVYFRQ